MGLLARVWVPDKRCALSGMTTWGHMGSGRGSARSALFSETSALNLKSDEGAYRAGALEQEALYRAPPMTDVSDEYRLKKLRFRAWRRGFREIDLILGRFTDAHGDAFTPEEFEAFEALLQAQDQDVYAWIIGQAEVPTAFRTPLMTRLQAFRLSL
jgi:antitoxin CptB